MSTNNEPNTEIEATETLVSDEQQINEQPPAQDTEASVEQPDTEQDITDTDTEPDLSNNAQKAAREAKKYRQQLREVEAERDALQARVDNFAQTILTSKLEQHTKIDNPNRYGVVDIALKHVDDFLNMSGKTAQDFIDDLGAFKQESFERTLGELYSARPELFDQKRNAPYVENIGNPVKTAPQNPFTNAFKPELYK